MVEVSSAVRNSHFYEAVYAINAIPRLSEGSRLVLDGFGKVVSATASLVGWDNVADSIDSVVKTSKVAKDFLFSPPKTCSGIKNFVSYKKINSKDFAYKISGISLGILADLSRLLESASKFDLIDLGRFKLFITKPGEWLAGYGLSFGPLSSVVLKMSGISKIFLTGKISIGLVIHIRDLYNGLERKKNIYRVANDVLNLSLIIFGVVMPGFVGGFLTIISASYSLRAHARSRIFREKCDKEKEYYKERQTVRDIRNLAVEGIQKTLPSQIRPRSLSTCEYSDFGFNSASHLKQRFSGKQQLIETDRQLNNIDNAFYTLRDYKKHSFKSDDGVTTQMEQEIIDLGNTIMDCEIKGYGNIRKVLISPSSANRSRRIQTLVDLLMKKEKELDDEFSKIWNFSGVRVGIPRSPTPRQRNYDIVVEDRKRAYLKVKKRLDKLRAMNELWLPGLA